jgi:hypothetical protein
MEKPDPIPRKKSARLAIYRSRPQRSRTLGLSALAVAAVGDYSNISAAGYSLWSLRCDSVGQVSALAPRLVSPVRRIQVGIGYPSPSGVFYQPD